MAKSSAPSSPAATPPAIRPPIDRRLLRSTPSARRAIGLAVVLGSLSAIAVVVQAVALADLIGGAFASHGRHWSLAATIVFVVTVLIRALCQLLSDAVGDRAASKVVRDLRAPVIASVTAGNETTSTSATVTLLTRGSDAVGTYLSRYVPALVLSIVAPAITICWIAVSDPVSGVIVMATVLVLPVFMVLLGKEAADRMRATWSTTALLSGHFADVLRGMRTLRSFNRAEAQVEVLEGAGERLRRTSMGTLRVALLSSFTLELLSSLATALVALSLGLRLIAGHLNLSVALAILIVTPEVYLPLRRASAQFHEATDGVGAASDLLDLAEAARPAPGPGGNRGPELLGAIAVGHTPSITLDGLVLGHDGSALWTAPVDLRLQAGQHVNLVGPSGSGKSTLLQALLGAHEPMKGRILIDDVDLADLDPIAWRRSLGWLPQHPHLIGGTLRDAIALREPDIDDDELLAMLDAIGLHEVVATDRSLLERSPEEVLRQLSGGERHRLALLRSLLGSPRLVALDEPTSHLDATSALDSAAIIRHRWEGVTGVLVTHEPSLLLPTDLVIDLGGRRLHA